MLDTGQPGELPLMRELIALKRARSLRDPSTVKSPGYENAAAPSNSNRKSPLRGHTGRSSETVKAGSGRGAHYHVGGQISSSSLARRIARKSVLPKPKISPSQGQDDNRHVGWDLGIQETVLGSETHRQQAVFGEFERRNLPMLGEDSLRKLTGDANDDDFSLQNWASIRKAQEEPEHAGKNEQVQTVDERGRVSEVSPVKAGSSSRNIGESFEFKNHIGPDRSPSTNRRLSTLRRETSTKQNSQILSPLMLNSHDDSLYAGAQQLSLFSLEGPLYDEQEHWKKEVKAHPYGVNTSTSRSISPFAREHSSQVGVPSTAEKTPWGLSQDLFSSSSHTSQRTLSQVSLPGAWEAPLDDELDVSELPQHGCGLPCHSSKGKSRSTGAIKHSSDASRRKGRGSPKGALRSQENRGADQVADDLSKPLHHGGMKTATLFTVPSARTDTSVETSSSAGRRRNYRGVNEELGSDDHITDEDPKKLTPSSQVENHGDHFNSNGKELAVFVERPRSLCQKYRPKTFEELVGQSLVTHALSNAVTRGKVAPVYLFQGSRGTGKTSAARIFAAALNCVTSGDRKPCNFCSECIATASGKTQDVQEIDAASHNGIERVKELLQSSFVAASGSRYKVFIIDECQMLTSETWNSLLKLLEEPPRNVVVILITTDSGKLPRSAISRCQKFLFPKIKHADIVSRLQKLVNLEKMDIEPGALDLMASKSEGSLRDAETMLDQLSLLCQRITLGTIHELVGSVSDDKLLSLLDLALSADTVSTVRRARELIESGIDPLDLMSQLATLITDILAGSYEIMNREQDRGFFSRHALSEAEMERLRTALKILSESEKQLREASKDRTTWLTAALLRFGPERPSNVPASSTSASLTPSPVSRFTRISKKFSESKTAARLLKREAKKKPIPKRALSTFENKIHGSAFRGASRSIKPGYEVRVHPTDQSSPHDGSRELSTESSVGQSPFSSEGDRRHSSFRSPGNLRSIWLNVLEACGSSPLRQLLQYHGRLLAMSFSAVDAVAHLEFAKPEHKHRAERYRRSIVNAFKKVLGLHVEIKISLASLPLSTGFTRSRMWTPAATERRHMQSASKKFTHHHTRIESDEAETDENNLEVGSLRHWKSQNAGPFNPKFDRSSSPYGFPAIPMFSMEPQPISRRQYRTAGSAQSRFGQEILMQERHRLETPWTDQGRAPSSSQFYQNPPLQKMRVSEGFGNTSQHHDQPLGTMNYTRSDLNKTADGLHAQKYVHGLSNFRDGAASESSFIEQENLRMESKMKYGGLLCWKAPKSEQEKATKQRRRRKRSVLIRLVPCVRSKRH